MRPRTPTRSTSRTSGSRRPSSRPGDPHRTGRSPPSKLDGGRSPTRRAGSSTPASSRTSAGCVRADPHPRRLRGHPPRAGAGPVPAARGPRLGGCGPGLARRDDVRFRPPRRRRRPPPGRGRRLRPLRRHPVESQALEHLSGVRNRAAPVGRRDRAPERKSGVAAADRDPVAAPRPGGARRPLLRENRRRRSRLTPPRSPASQRRGTASSRPPTRCSWRWWLRTPGRCSTRPSRRSPTSTKLPLLVALAREAIQGGPTAETLALGRRTERADVRILLALTNRGARVAGDGGWFGREAVRGSRSTGGWSSSGRWRRWPLRVRDPSSPATP